MSEYQACQTEVERLKKQIATHDIAEDHRQCACHDCVSLWDQVRVQWDKMLVLEDASAALNS